MTRGALIEPGAVAERRDAGSVSYHEFLNREGENQHVEWVDGRTEAMSPVSRMHQDVAGFLKALLRIYVEHRELGQVLDDPFQMKTGPGLPGRAPDIVFVATKHLRRLKEKYLDGPGDLVVEVISAGSRAVDRGEKYYEYEQGGVPEYWMIDPDRKQAEFYLLGKDSVYRPQIVAGDDVYRSKMIPGLWLKIGWLWRRPLPSVINVMRQWKLVE